MVLRHIGLFGLWSANGGFHTSMGQRPIDQIKPKIRAEGPLYRYSETEMRFIPVAP
jgi:hypothetical protein